MSARLTWSESRRPVVFDRPHVLLVEGHDEQSFAAAQLGHLKLADSWQIHNMGGVRQKWGAAVRVVLDDASFAVAGRAIGVVLDADSSTAAAFNKARSALLDAGLPYSGPAGAVEESGDLRFGVFVMPDNSSTGSLEDLLLSAARGDGLSLAREYLARLDSAPGVPPLLHRSKKLMQAFLVAQREFVANTRVAFQKREVFDPSSPEFSAFSDFLTALSPEARSSN